LKMEMMGAGAIGGITGGLLVKSSEDVTLVDTLDEHVEKIDSEGYVVGELDESITDRVVGIGRLLGLVEQTEVTDNTGGTCGAGWSEYSSPSSRWFEMRRTTRASRRSSR